MQTPDTVLFKLATTLQILLIAAALGAPYRGTAGKADSSAKVSYDTAALAELENYNTLLMDAFKKGYNYKAREYAARALIVALGNRMEHKTGLAYSNLSIVNARMGDYEKANQHNFNALRIFKALNDSLHIARCNLNIGNVYIRLKEYPRALSYISEAKNTFYSLHDQLGYSICLSNTGSIYLEMRDYKKALPIFFEAVGIDEKNHDVEGTASNFASIGEVYIHLNNYEAAAKYLNKALAIEKVIGDISGKANIYKQFARLMLLSRKPDSALYYNKLSSGMYHEAGELSEVAVTYKQFADIYEALGDYKTAFGYQIRSDALSDSLLNVEKAARIAMLEEKFINEKLNHDIVALQYRSSLQEARIKWQKTINTAWLSGLILSGIAIIIIVAQLRKKNAAYRFIVRKNLDMLNRERELESARIKLQELNEAELNEAEEQEIADKKAGETLTGEQYGDRSKQRLVLAPSDKARLLQKLHNALSAEKIFTRADLTIDKLSRKLQTNRTYLSQLINEEFGRSYSDLINEYRIREAMALLSDKVLAQKYSIEAIAHESGFNNISTFNALFRKHVGLTPSIFRKNAHLQSVATPEIINDLTNS